MKLKRVLTAALIVAGLTLTSCVKSGTGATTTSIVDHGTTSNPTTTTTQDSPSTTTGNAPQTTTTTTQGGVVVTTTGTTTPVTPTGTTIIPTTTTTTPVTPTTTTTQSGVTPTTTTTTPVTPTTTTTQGGVTPTTTTTTSGSSTPVTPGKNGSEEGALDAGNGEVLDEGSFEITSVSGELESAYVEFKPVSGYTDYNVYISNKDADNYTKLERNQDYFLQSLSATNNRIDISGIKKGSYDIKISAAQDGVDKGNPAILNVDVAEYDRSGYAHFNYNEGVGAYNDDGTLKDNAIVLYVTDATKNTVELSYKGKTVNGIGNILNSVGKASGDAGHETECKKVDTEKNKTYYAKGNTNQGILSDLAADNIPLVIRFVGLISESGLYAPGTYNAQDLGQIDGLTDYALKSTVKDNGNLADYGGTGGDNGHMARMKSAKNVTIEGIGNDAGLDGWGIHFMCESAFKDYGKSFEVRNLVFMNTPEDAIGMEGVASSTKITASVERCWIHHNTFLAPHISNPAESDKGEGDGSCDFKRGMYYTLAYNYFEYCHKTNLVGSSDSSLQFNMTFHHNVWYNCGSRIPLLRQANIHFYNNYVYGDSNDKSANLSYVTSLRANSYMYVENNFYEGGKNVFTDTGGNAKLLNNEFVQCFGDMVGTVVYDREASVSSKCAYDGTSYANFDSNPSLFYYDSVNHVSDCYLTTASVAREEDIKYSGSKYRTILNKTALKTDPKFNVETPTTAVQMKDISLPTSKTSGVVDNIVWTGITGYSATTGVKFRGKAATFKLDNAATMTIALTSGSNAALNAGSVIRSDGKVAISGSGTAVLEPGIYVIVSCQKDKDSYITSLSFAEYDSAELTAQLIAQYNEAYSAIPSTIVYTDDCYNKINAAISAYDKLGAAKSEITNYDDVLAALAQYEYLGVQDVVAAINAIGTVTKDSATVITTARNKYTKLMSKCPTATVSNYQTLEQAEAAFASFALDACIEAIDAIGTVTLESLDKITTAETLYEQLDDDQKDSVTNYSVLVEARATYNSLVAIKDLNDAIASAGSLQEYEACYNAYQALTATQKSQINGYDQMVVNYAIALIDTIPATVGLSDGTTISKARSVYDSIDSSLQPNVTNYDKLTTAETQYNNLASQVIKWSYDGKYTSSVISASGSARSETVKFGTEEFTKALKLQSSAGEISFTISSTREVTIFSTNATTIKFNGTAKSVTSGSATTITLEAGTYKLTKGDGEARVFAIFIQ